MFRSAVTRRCRKSPFDRSAGPACIRQEDIGKMSRSDHDEPLQWHWLYIPLVAYLVFAVGPSVLAPIFFILSLFVEISSIIGPAQQAPGIGSILLEPIFLGLIFWPFLWLYGCARDELIKDPSSEASIRLATIMSACSATIWIRIPILIVALDRPSQ
jgi:hypothetical protein